jgi:hypothetical protein
VYGISEKVVNVVAYESFGYFLRDKVTRNGTGEN